MNEKVLHIITHDVPWPADFGGVMDLFYKIKTLHQAGVKIHLHCFVKDRQPQEELNKYCKTVNYYQRKKLSGISFNTPFIVQSRRCAELLSNLQKDKHPILMEGIHCSYYLNSGKLNGRTLLLRLHNAEFEYYHQLSLHEKHPFKKFYYKTESWLLKKYERRIAANTTIAAVSQQDVDMYHDQFNAGNIFHLPVFIPFTDALGKTGRGCYCLYHGNLSINENEEAVVWLLENIFNKLPIPFVIAGKNPSQRLEYLAHQHEHTCLVANPDDKALHDMIAKAQVNILPSFNNTGVKLKLLNALCNGRHCLVNHAGVDGSGLEALCTIAEGTEEFTNAINHLFYLPFEEEQNEKRRASLLRHYNNQKNVEKLIDIFWSDKVTS